VTSPLSDAEYLALAEFRQALRRFLQFSEQAAEGLGLTPQQHQALLAIRGFGGAAGLAMGELAERLQIRHHSAAGLVARLEAQGLVARRPGTADRRQVYVSLLPKAAALLERLSRPHRAELRRVSPLLLDILGRIGAAHPPE
jgi:DNA-binding MarR family transcriptional regulator